jgi:hypothetical protein
VNKKMERKKIMLILLLMMVSVAIMIFYASQNIMRARSYVQHTLDDLVNPEGPVLVTPEAPLGTLGLLVAIFTALMALKLFKTNKIPLPTIPFK